MGPVVTNEWLQVKKTDIVDRFSESYISEKVPIDGTELQAPWGFPSTSQWKRLEPKVDPIISPKSRGFWNTMQLNIPTEVDWFDYEFFYKRRVCREEFNIYF